MCTSRESIAHTADDAVQAGSSCHLSDCGRKHYVPTWQLAQVTMSQELNRNNQVFLSLPLVSTLKQWHLFWWNRDCKTFLSRLYWECRRMTIPWRRGTWAVQDVSHMEISWLDCSLRGQPHTYVFDTGSRCDFCQSDFRKVEWSHIIKEKYVITRKGADTRGRAVTVK